MWTKPAAAGAAIVTALALGVWAGGASTPEDTSSIVQAEQPARDHGNGHKRGHDKPRGAEKPDKSDKADKGDKGDKPGKPRRPGHHTDALPPRPPGLDKPRKPCVGPARDGSGELEACPRKPHPHGKVVPVGPRPYSETEE